MNHHDDNCWIWFIILWGWSFLSVMIMLITVIVLGLYRCEFVNLHGSLFLKTPSVCNVKNSTWMHVESSLHASIRPKTSQITVKVQVQLEKKSTKTFSGSNYSIPPLLLRFSQTCKFWSSKANWRLHFSLLSVILTDLLENKTLLWRVQKVKVCDLWLVDFNLFSVFLCFKVHCLWS